MSGRSFLLYALKGIYSQAFHNSSLFACQATKSIRSTIGGFKVINPFIYFALVFVFII